MKPADNTIFYCNYKDASQSEASQENSNWPTLSIGCQLNAALDTSQVLF
jgi:hypothetical protein